MISGSLVARVMGVSKTFATSGAEPVVAVRDASLELRGGEVTLISGASGSGKTTLLSIIGGLIPPSHGEVELGGRALRSLSQAELTMLRLRTIGYVFQGFRLIDALTAAENVELPLNLAGTLRPASRDRAIGLLQRLSLNDRLDAFPQTMSAGEKQRVAIARAFANDPPLLLADEPTGSLDSRAGQNVIEILQAAARVHGRAVLIVSHDHRIQRYADHLLEMEDGGLRQYARVGPGT
jgi:putative ABC transport system ATP-binding protein